MGKVMKLTASSKKALRDVVEGIEKAISDVAKASEHVKDSFDKAKTQGYDVKAIRKIIAMRKVPKAKRQEEEHLLHTYMLALDMVEPDEGRRATDEDEDAA